ncbi:Septum-promoting GTP-binding protein 1 [Camellia lanceoleosa]|uniref:Septum-promoting GTP-binding protein 1 n=1 Tax=Camellia lanceoleosa TaxID=1840588 RepID=A0ACC0HI70_9ERIC|nr:Septum-promoting GTP-binding protein 1 [Camellia lanceoleosa]
MSSLSLVASERGFENPGTPCGCCEHSRPSSDLVALKISLLGDSQIGKTSFLASAFFFLGHTKYVGGERQEEGFGISDSGLNQMDKTLCVREARIAYRIWEVTRDETSQNHIPSACKDSIAMLLMFDLTSRCTFNSIVRWYQESRKWNQTTIPVLIGTKFDDFVKLPIDVQWTIASKSICKGPECNTFLFKRNLQHNVNKIFKFIMAKLFNLPWALERNLTIREPIINF